jgi:SAM-dependent methyltransferase
MSTLRQSARVQKLPPAWLIKTINTFRTFLIRLNRKLFPGNVVLYELFQNFWLLPSVYVAAKLDIATLLKNKPLTASEIADRLEVDTSNISRILRALSSQGIFKQTRDGRFALNEMSRGLLDEPGSLRFMILHHLGPVNWNLMSNLEFAVRSGKDAFTDKYGKEIYDYLKDHPAEYALFDKSMSNLSDLGLAPILNVYDFSKFSLIVDIGGGEGFFLANILHHNHRCRGLLFDTAEALEKAPEMLIHHQVADRAEIVPGNFFNSIPGSGDLYILKNIIHNWDDEKSVELLKKIHQSIKPDSILLIIEMVVPIGNKPSLAKLLDIQMMGTMPGGKERMAKEYSVLLEKSGFRLTRIIPTIAPISLIEAKNNR